MVPSIRVTHDLADMARWARGMAAEQVPFASALSLTLTANDVRQALQREVASRFERPTPFTRNAFRTIPARKDNLVASVIWRGYDTRNWLSPQAYGGERKAKALERALRAAGHLPEGWYAVPAAGARLDQYGNMERGQIIQILSQLRITMTAGHTRNMSLDSRKAIAAQRKAGGRFFVIKPGADNAGPGVYQRELNGRNITPVVAFVDRVSYRVRLPLQQIAEPVVKARLDENFRTAMRRALATAR